MFLCNCYNTSSTLIFDISQSSVTVKSGGIGNNTYMDLFGELNWASRVQRFEIRGIKIFFCWNGENNLYSDDKGLPKDACLVGELMKCECYQSQW